MNPDREALYLAALLHDIGKFWQRADSNGYLKSTNLSSNIKNAADNYCPSYNGGLSYQHVLWTAQFFETYKAVFSKLPTEISNQLEKLASYHHKPGSELQKIIQKADHFSSGMDHSPDEDPGDSSDGFGSFKTKLMKSVFESVFNTDGKYSKVLPLTEINLDNSIFPKQEGNITATYNALWNKFTQELTNLNGTDSKVIGETILYLLHKYTSAIPSSTLHLPDVSLFDHAKTTAGFAICLYDYLLEESEQFKVTIGPEDKPFLLFGGDLSGIQNYLYDILSRNAAKNLKGRSFYLQVLVETIIQKVLSRLDLYQANVVYASGGSFYILLPNTPKTKDIIHELENEFSTGLLKEHGTSLYLAMDYTELSLQDIVNQNISEPWSLLDK